ncbi:hypothetical protein Zm00014a_041846, partial [Zea mays]
VHRFFCQKCGAEGHHARYCFKSLWCDICRKETHMTAKCVLPKQNKPCMPIVGMAVDGLGFYSSHFAKPLSRKPKKSFIGLVKVVEGLISAEDLEKDFGFHFPWGKTWKATKCHSGFLIQFPSQEKLDEVINFPELKMKMSGAKISVSSWSSQAKPKSKLHSLWIVAENVPEELQNYQAIYELGSTIGVVEEVDILSLDTKDIVRLKVHVKSVAMIPPIIEVGVKPFLYDIYFKTDNITDVGWNDDSINLGKRASIDRQGFGDPTFEKSGKKARNVGDKSEKEDLRLENIGDIMSQGKNFGRCFEVSDGMEDVKPMDEDKGYDDNPINEEDDFNESEDDLMSSQDLEEFAKDDDVVLPSPQDKDNKILAVSQTEGVVKNDGEKAVNMEVDHVEGIRRSSRLESNDEMKIADKATARAIAKDAFINKGMSSNPFSILNTENSVLMNIASDLGIELGPSFTESVVNLELIKSLELSRKNLAIQSVKSPLGPSLPVVFESKVDKIIQNEEEYNELTDMDNVMVLRKGRKIHHKKYAKKKKKKSPPKLRYTPNKREGSLF